ncbi:hypothetical protein C8Q75DRAFT_377439 [Abortiporus biennis]|nr:hypothetical protein C8Q75DRAFT_377439 [Abortiporus biennis]
MSIQIHSPSPIISSGPVSAQSLSRSKSPSNSPSTSISQLPQQRQAMARPPSRSEKLLRDTLRKAEEQERLANLAALPSSPLFGAPLPHSSAPVQPQLRRRPRRNTSSSTGTDAESFEGISSPVFGFAAEQDPEYECDEEDECVDEWLWNKLSMSTTSTSSDSSGNHPGFFQQLPTSPPPPLLPAHSLKPSHSRTGSRSRSHTDPTGGQGSQCQSTEFYGTPKSPSPMRTHYQRASKSVPSVPRTSSKRTSLDGGTAGVYDMTPHEAVLRSRLEGVLRGAKEQERRTKSRERYVYPDEKYVGGSSSGGSGSMASSRNMSGSGEGSDWFFSNSNGESPYATPLMSREQMRARERGNFSPPRPPPLNLPRSPRQQQVPLSRPPIPHTASHPPLVQSRPHVTYTTPSSPRHRNLGPLTPPPTPPSHGRSASTSSPQYTPFNAREAAAQCRAMNGYVSFANVEGLGVPDEYLNDDPEDDEAKGRGRWLKWLSIGGGKESSKEITRVGRDRSGSIESMGSR